MPLLGPRRGPSAEAADGPDNPGLGVRVPGGPPPQIDKLAVKGVALRQYQVWPLGESRRKLPEGGVFVYTGTVKPFKDWKTEDWSGAATVLLLFFGLPLLVWLSGRSSLFTPSAPPTATPPAAYQPQRAVLSGTIVCLPPAPDYPPAEECVPGLHADDGANYALNFNLMSEAPAPHKVGDRVSASGTLILIERLNTDHWRRYDAKAIFSVTDSFRVVR